jgi:hypothetical protein
MKPGLSESQKETLKAKALKEEVSRQIKAKQEVQVEKYVDIVEFGK